MGRSIAKGALLLLVGSFIGSGSMQMLHAQQGAQRTELKRVDLAGASGTELIMGISEFQPGAVIPRHFHHGDEMFYVLEGSTLEPPGQAPVTLKTGGSVHYAREVPHGGAKVVGNTPLKLLTFHVVDKGKPLSEALK